MKKISLLFYCFFITTFSISINNAMETPLNSPDYSNMSKAGLIERIRCLESMLRAKNLAEQKQSNAMKEFAEYQCNETDHTRKVDDPELSDCICS